jgi:glutamate N-acetyltransferase/amino-acid N-acetyltransferase
LPFSTGVIGERLGSEKIIKVLPGLLEALDADHWQEAASAIMTTDTVAKIASIRITVANTTYHVTGITKGSGMIHPDMATMLAFIATDANIPEPHLRKMLGECINTSFNRISVDGDTSTNDACVLTATGQARGGPTLTPQHPHWAAIVDGVGRVCEALAKSIVRDGEGATKFIEVVVDSPAQAASLAIATTVAQSPLVKTALFASDPNWGRILAAVGRAPVDSMRVEDISIWLDVARCPSVLHSSRRACWPRLSPPRAHRCRPRGTGRPSRHRYKRRNRRLDRSRISPRATASPACT